MTDSQLKDKAHGFGINLIGYISGNLGLGVSARHYLRFMQEAGMDVCPVEVPVSGGRAGQDLSYAKQWVSLDTPTPHSVNLFVMNPHELTALLKEGHAAIQTEGRINIALPFWELPRIPNRWIPCLNEMDIVIAPSGFLKYAMMADLDGPCVRDFPHPIYIPPGITSDRDRWEIPEDTTAFAFSFEMASDINRKNPLATITAFERAFTGRDDATLIINVNNSASEPCFAPHLERLQDTVSRNPNIRLVDQVVSYEDVLSLFASCDVYVSLHRAEGLGLCLMEAMNLGKPVIATGWSGNMAFANERNSCLVGYDLVPVCKTTQNAYDFELVGDAHWAEARIDDAVHWMRRLASESGLCDRIGSRAAADMGSYQDRIDAGELVASVRNLALRRGTSI